MFGLVDTSYSPSVSYMQSVPRRDSATQFPIVQSHEPHSPRYHYPYNYTDQGSMYNMLSTVPGVASHGTVNHSVEFVDSTTGVHTRNIESLWCRVKKKLKRMKWCHEGELSGYLDEFMWREHHGTTPRLAFNNIMCDIADQYPLP